jgi:hypothetical protein
MGLEHNDVAWSMKSSPGSFSQLSLKEGRKAKVEAKRWLK